MESRPIWHWLLIAVLAWVAYLIFRSLLGFVAHVLFFVLQIALLVAIIWVIYALVTRRKAY